MSNFTAGMDPCVVVLLNHPEVVRNNPMIVDSSGAQWFEEVWHGSVGLNHPKLMSSSSKGQDSLARAFPVHGWVGLCQTRVSILLLYSSGTSVHIIQCLHLHCTLGSAMHSLHLHCTLGRAMHSLHSAKTVQLQCNALLKGVLERGVE